MNTHRPSVLIIAAEDIVVRNIIDTDVWDILKPSLYDADLTLVAPKGRSAELSKRFAEENVRIKEFTREAPSRFDSFIATLLYAGLPTHTNHWSKMRVYLRGQSSLFSAYLKRLHAAVLGRIHPYQRLLRRLYLQNEDANARALFDEVRPSLVISLSITNFEIDVILLREAKRRGIRTVGMTRSWDNLTSHGALRVVPDRLIVQNDFLCDAARGVQGVRASDAAVDVIGLPHYDAARNISAYAGTREDFCKEHGLDPAKKIVLYGAMGTFLFIRENDLLRLFSKLVTENAFREPVQILYRPHPKFPVPEDLEDLPGVVIDHSGTYRTKAADERSASEEVFRSIHHADVVATAASTFAIDAALLDKPVVCINFDGSAKPGEIRYWESVGRFFDSYTHFEELLAQGGIRVARTQGAFIGAVRAYLADPSLEKEGRARIVRRLVGVADGRASERLAAVLSDEILRSGNL